MKKPAKKHRLELDRETIRTLDDQQLVSVVGGTGHISQGASCANIVRPR